MTPAQPYGFLQGISANVQNVRVDLSNEDVLIGRGTACQIQLKDPKVSRQHTRLRFQQGLVILEDLNSAHGTWVDGVRVTAAQLKGGEELTLGDSHFRFDLVAIAAPVAQPVRPAPSPQPAVVQVPQPGVPPLAAEAPRSRRWLLFLGGFAIPIILGVIVVGSLIALGVFDATDELPTVDRAEPLPIDVAAEEEPIEPPEAPQYTFRPYNPASDSHLPVQSDLASYDDQAGDPDFFYTVPLAVGEEVILDYFYCGKSEAILEAISTSIRVSFEIDGVQLPDETLHTERLVMATRACYISRGVYQRMTPGENVLVQVMDVTDQIDDGWETWGPETLESRILIRVEGQTAVPAETSEPEFATSQPAAPTNNDSPPAERTVNLHVGDARRFSTPPQVIAYANTQVSPAPPEIAIDEECGEGCFRFNEWIGLRGANRWMEGYATVSTTAIGVQFWGDAGDGLARVYLNGTEIWSGDTRGEDNQWPGGAFVRYLEISGLPEGNHSLIVESLGEGGSVTLYFFGIGPVVP